MVGLVFRSVKKYWSRKKGLWYQNNFIALMPKSPRSISKILYKFDRIHWCLMSLIAYYCLCRYLANFVFFKIKDSTALNMTWYDQFMQCVILCIMLLLILSLYTKLLIKYPLFWCIFSFKNSCIVFVLNLEYFVKSNTSDREVL